MTSTRARVTKNGQVSIPAAVRRRWQVSEVLVIDEGDYVTVRPMPTDPIAALRGIFRDPDGLPSDELRAQAREEDFEAEQRRLSQ